MITVAIIGILATIGIPTFMRFQLKSKAAEVKSNIAAIRTTQEGYFAEWGLYVSAVPPIPAAVSSNRVAWPLAPGDVHGFNQLGFVPEGLVYFQYGVTASQTPLAYTIAARSDIDNDAAFNTWGYVDAAQGAAAGIAGPFGSCQATGVYDSSTGLFNRLSEVGPCDAQSAGSEF